MEAVPDRVEEQFPEITVRIYDQSPVRMARARDALMYWQVAQPESNVIVTMGCPASIVREALAIEEIYDGYTLTERPTTQEDE